MITSFGEEERPAVPLEERQDCANVCPVAAILPKDSAGKP
jgi:hypothetical protein